MKDNTNIITNIISNSFCASVKVGDSGLSSYEYDFVLIHMRPSIFTVQRLAQDDKEYYNLLS